MSSGYNSSVEMDKTELLIAKGSLNLLLMLFKLNGSLKILKYNASYGFKYTASIVIKLE